MLHPDALMHEGLWAQYNARLEADHLPYHQLAGLGLVNIEPRRDPPKGSPTAMALYVFLVDHLSCPTSRRPSWTTHPSSFDPRDPHTCW
jgi:hypothetical protein